MIKYIIYKVLLLSLLVASCIPIKKYEKLNKQITYKERSLEKRKRELAQLRTDSIRLNDSLNIVRAKWEK
jgi:hypothetical protein